MIGLDLDPCSTRGTKIRGCDSLRLTGVDLRMTRQSTSTSVKMPLSFHGGIRSKKIPGWILRLRSDISGLRGLKNFLLGTP